MKSLSTPPFDGTGQPSLTIALQQGSSWFWQKIPGADSNWMMALSIHILAVVLLSSIAHFFISRVGKRMVLTGKGPEGLNLVGTFFLPVEVFLICATIGFVPETMTVPVHAAAVLEGIAKFGTIFSMMFIALRAIRILAAVYMRKLKIDQPDNLRERRLKTQVQYLEKIIDIAVIFFAIVGVMLSFDSFRRFGGSLLASAGLASVIVGFSAQRSLGNLIAGFQIAFTQPIRWGDAVLIEGEWGEIEEITLTYVVVRIWDLRRLVLPITYFLEKPFQNWTRTSADLIGQILLYVDYSLPVQAVREHLVKILKTEPLWDGKTVALQVVDASERTMTLRALVSARTAGQTFDLRCLVREKLIAFIQSEHAVGLPKARVGRLEFENSTENQALPGKNSSAETHGEA